MLHVKERRTNEEIVGICLWSTISEVGLCYNFFDHRDFTNSVPTVVVVQPESVTSQRLTTSWQVTSKK